MQRESAKAHSLGITGERFGHIAAAQDLLVGFVVSNSAPGAACGSGRLVYWKRAEDVDLEMG